MKNTHIENKWKYFVGSRLTIMLHNQS